MADNSTQTGSDTIATDELATLNSADVSGASPRIKVQRAKVGFGSDGDFRDIDGDHPLPGRGGNDPVASGSLAANGDTLVAAVTPGATEWGAYLQGTYATGATVQFEASVDGGTVYFPALMQRQDAGGNVPTASVAPGVNGSRAFRGTIPPGATHVRLRVSAWASPTGSIIARIGQRFNPGAPWVGLIGNGVANPQNVQVGDGVDTASVLARGTAPASTDAGVAVVELIGSRPAYQVVTSEITSATATGVKENLTLWHPSTLLKDVFILEIGVNVRVVQTAGTFAWELQFISAENGTPGGTALTPQPLNLGSAASGVTPRQVVTGAPTVTGAIFGRAPFPLPAAATPFDGDPVILFQAHDPEDAIQLRSGQNEGLRISQNIAATLTTAPIFDIYARYIERA